jgi:hypothetical protein
MLGLWPLLKSALASSRSAWVINPCLRDIESWMRRRIFVCIRQGLRIQECWGREKFIKASFQFVILSSECLKKHKKFMTCLFLYRIAHHSFLHKHKVALDSQKCVLLLSSTV